MAFNEDLSVFFSTDDFADDAIITRSNQSALKIKVIFENPDVAAQFYDSQVTAKTFSAQCRTSDLNGVKKRDAIFVKGKTYEIDKIEDDGTGVTQLSLK